MLRRRARESRVPTMWLHSTPKQHTTLKVREHLPLPTFCCWKDARKKPAVSDAPSQRGGRRWGTALCPPHREALGDQKRSKRVCTWSCLQGNLPPGDRAEDKQLYTKSSQNPNLRPQALGHPEGGCSEITGPACARRACKPLTDSSARTASCGLT